MKSTAIARCALVVLFALLVTAFAGPRASAAQQRSDLVITAVDTSRYPHVEVYIATPNDTSAALDAAQPATVQEIVGGQRRLITPRLEQFHQGVSVLVLVDLHRRMRGIGMPLSATTPITYMSRLDTAREAIRQLSQALLSASQGQSRLGVMGYHRDLIEIMPLQPLEAGLVEAYIQPGGSRQRLLDIERKRGSSPPNDPSDPHAQSALALAVRWAADILAAYAPPDQQRVIVIIGSTCTDLQPELTYRSDVTCDGIEQTAQYIQQRAHANLLSIYGVGVGSDKPKEPQIAPKDSDSGFNYTANFNQIQHFAQPAERFFHLHTTDPANKDAIWADFDRTIIAPIRDRATQLKVSFEAAPPPRGTSVVSTTVQIELAGNVVQTVFAVPQIDLLLNGTPITTTTLSLQPGAFNLAARYRSTSAPLDSSGVQVVVPTPAPTPAPPPIEPSIRRMDWISLIASLLAFLLAIAAVIYWRRQTRPTPLPTPAAAQVGVDATQIQQLDAATKQSLIDSTRTTRHYLQQVLGPRPGEIYPIYEATTWIGSAKDRVHLLVENEYVNPQHARLELVGDTLSITDNNSQNFTYLNDVQLKAGTPISLKPNDMLALAWVTFTYLHVDPAPRPVKLRTPARGETGRLAAVGANTGANTPAAEAEAKP